MCLPVRRFTSTRSATAIMRLRVIDATASRDRPFGLKAPGTVEMLPSSSVREGFSGKHGSTVRRERHALALAPIRQIDVFLHPDTVERAEGKGIDGENIRAERRQLIAERG